MGCEGPSLRCLPGLRLHLGERNQDRCLFRLSRALPHPGEQGWNAVGHGSDTLGYRKPLPVRRGPMLLSPRVLLRSAWSSREIRTGARGIEGTFPKIFPRKETFSGYFLCSLRLHGGQRSAITACLRLHPSSVFGPQFLWCKLVGGGG